jgi:hypothetical protein
MVIWKIDLEVLGYVLTAVEGAVLARGVVYEERGNLSNLEDNGHAMVTDDSSNVYKFLKRRLLRRGWTKHQYSCWRSINKGFIAAQTDVIQIAGQFEAQYRVGVFIHSDSSDTSNSFRCAKKNTERSDRKNPPRITWRFAT